MDAFQTRVATVRSEIAAWKAVHARMWEALGPEAGSSEMANGVGGAVATAPAGDVARGPAEELHLLATTVAEEGPRLQDLEHVIDRTGRMMSALPLRWPVRGPVNSEFGRRRSPWSGKSEQHDGIDIGTPPGTAVACPAAGTVVAAGAGGDFGRHVMLDHGNSVRSIYGHLKSLDVKAGQRVEKGQRVGLVGSTGRSTGPHLHYEVRVDGKPVDPRAFLWER
jgi:murein DD-endopeptidase MepM/ murein hydrolase activator NlpD